MKRVSLFITIIVASVLFFSSCQQPAADKPKPEDKSAKALSAKDSTIAKKNIPTVTDSTSNLILLPEATNIPSDGKPLPEDAKKSTDKLELLNANAFGCITLSEYLAQGAEIFLTSCKKAFDVTSLIDYAKDPSQVCVYADGFNSWTVSEIVEKEAKVMLSCRSFTSFEILSLIKQAPKPDRITVVCRGCASADVYKYLEAGARVLFNNQYQPFHILSFIDKGKDLVEIDVRGFKPEWVMNFVERGAKIRIDASFKAFDILQFAVAGGNRVSVCGKNISLKNLARFIDAGAKVYVGRYSNPDSPGRYFNSYEVSSLIAKNASNVVIIGDYFASAEINRFMKDGAKVIFTRTPNIYDISVYLFGMEPPDKSALSLYSKPKSGRVALPRHCKPCK